MGFSVWPAPEDSGVVGPTGAAGTNGTPGKSVLQGATVPAGSLGVDGDVYLMKTENTFLGVTSATVAVYVKAAGAWTKVGTDMRGAAWYVNTASTGSSETKLGDMLLRTDTGDLWQRNGSGWGTPVGNLKGAPGSKVYVFANAAESGAVTAADGDMAVRTDTGSVSTYVAGTGWVIKGNITGAAGSDGAAGATGAQGPKGDPGSVDTVNGKSGPAVTLTALDVNAMPTSGGTFTADVAFNGAAGAYRQWSLDVGGVKRWTFQKDDVAEDALGAGSNFRLSSRNNDGTFKSTVLFADRGTGQVSFGSTIPLANAKTTVAGGVGLRNTTTPTANTGGATLFSSGGKLKVVEGDGAITDIAPALPVTGGTVTGAVDVRPASGNGLSVYGSTSPATYFRVTADGHPYSNSERATFYNVGVGDTSTPFGGGVRVLGMQNASVIPTSNPANGVVAYAEAGVMKVRQSNGTIVQVGAPGGAKNSWTPQSLGFQAWSHDPATIPNTFDWKAYIDSNGATQRGALKPATIGRTYFAGINITETTTVSKVVVFARGWGGSTLIPAARFFGGIYNEAGSRVAWTGATALSNVAPAGQETGTPAAVKNGHSGAVPLSLSASITLQPGRYWATFLMSAGAATDFYYHFVENWAVSNPANFHLLSPAFMRAGYLSSQTTLAATITPANMLTDHDPIVMALA